MKKYVFYEDGGHGWLKVSKKELVKLGIENQISGCSLMRGEYAYLEEDLDLSTFIEALAKTHGIDLNCNHASIIIDFRNMFWSNTKRMSTDKQSKLRSYDGYEVIPENVLAKMNEFKSLMLSKINYNTKAINTIKRGNLKDCKFWNDYYHYHFEF